MPAVAIPDFNISVDHVLPQDYFNKQIRGWENVPKDLQDALINGRDNLQPMLKNANSSKGARVELPENPPPFTSWGADTVDEGYRAMLLDTQQKMREHAERLAAQYRK